MSIANASEPQIIALEPRLHWFADELIGDRFEDAEHAGDRHQLRVKLVAKDARAGVASCTCERPTSQCRIDMYTTVGHDLGTCTDDSSDDQIALTRIYALTGAHRLQMQLRG